MHASATDTAAQPTATDIVTVTLNPALDKTCAVDQVVPDRKLRCGPPGFHPGGGGINVARAIRKLGGEALAVWMCGGATGDLLRSLMEAESLNHRAVRIENMTRENLMIYEEAGQQQYRFGMPGAKLSAAEIQDCQQQLKALQPTPTYVVLSGSLPPEADDGLYADFVSQLSKDCRIILDTSGTALQEGVREGVYLIKPNKRELEKLAGDTIRDDTQIRKVAYQLIDAGKVQVVVASLGAGGAVVTSAETHTHIRAPTVDIRSRVGAGDSMVAGIVLALSRGSSVADAARFGVASGAAAVMTDGTELCRREDTERLYQQICAEASSSAG